MAITLITGQPGHGKTQHAISLAMKMASEGRTVYAGNVRGLKYADAGFIPLESFDQWESLPDGSVVLWDECYDAIPQRAAGRAVPKHVEALARHRHRGFDFLLVCQQPRQLDSFVFGLVENHLHCRRKFRSKTVRIKMWDRAESSPDKATQLESKVWRLDPKIWLLYESATQHTMQPKYPWYYFALPVAAILTVAAFVGIPALFVDRASALEEESRKQKAGVAEWAGPAGLLAGTPGTDRADYRRNDPLTLMQPRLPTSPWTAPAYDGVEFSQPPRIACMSSADSCTCLTIDQGTHWMIDDEMCRLIARYGRYDPTYQSSGDRRRDG